MMGVTMTTSTILPHWQAWIRSNPERSPWLARTLPRWSEIYPDETLDASERMNGSQVSTLDWNDFALEDPDSMDEHLWMLPRLEEGLASAMNRTAFDRLLELTMPNERPSEITLTNLRANAATSPVEQRFALMEARVPLETHMDWLASWWLQDSSPAGMPTPPWVIDQATHYPEPEWTPRQAPRSPWLMEWVREWGPRTHG